jgi:hypothetical protein
VHRFCRHPDRGGLYLIGPSQSSGLVEPARDAVGDDSAGVNCFGRELRL